MPVLLQATTWCPAPLRWVVVVAGVALAAGARADGPPATESGDPAGVEFFEKQVRPILSHRCFPCHSGRVAEPKGNLRLDSRAGVLQGGDTGPAAVSGDPAQSLMIDAVNYGELYQMPPKARLPAEEVAALTRWVQIGLPWPAAAAQATADAARTYDMPSRRAAHWCWQPVRRPRLPVVRDAQWAQSPIDCFVLARLEQAGLRPAPRADRATLLRRATFDLLGLPPTSDELDAFERDERPGAWERALDRLLASPQFGERWARHWMDLVRYAETCGHEFDFPIADAWRYRDYLIRAWNADLPYDQLALEHIAGDLLPEPRRNPVEGFNESIIGTGSWFLGEALHAPVDVSADQANRIANQLDVFGKTFLGLTVACARCHDHKFDAISTVDYYALAGYLQSSRRQMTELDPRGRLQHVAQELNAECAAASETQRQTWDGSGAEQADWFAAHLLASQDTTQAGGALWARALADDAVRRVDHPLYAWAALPGERGPAAKDSVEHLRDTLRAQEAAWEAWAAQTSVLADFNSRGFGDWFVSGAAFGDGPTTGQEWDPLARDWRCLIPGVAHSGRWGKALRGTLRSPTFTIDSDHLFYHLAGEQAEIRLIVDGYTMIEFHQLLFGGMKFDVQTQGRWQWHHESGDLGRYRGHRAYLEIIDSGNGWAAVDEIRSADSGAAPPDRPSRIALDGLSDPAEVTYASLAEAYGRAWSRAWSNWHSGTLDADSARLIDWALEYRLLPGTEPASAASQRLASQAAERDATEARVPAPEYVLTMCDGTGENERVHIRGSNRTLGPEVPRRFLEALEDSPPSATARGSRRLELARQVADPANPLTARVMVNRLWYHVMGRGLVASVDNFGVLGDAPTHPELLDYLADELVRQGWSMKRLLRDIMLSNTYQMASVADQASEQLDPDNHLWHRAELRRLEAEAIRDSILSVSGRLDRQQFGPSVPVHVTPFMQGRGRPSRSGPPDGDGRRSVYLEIRRNFLAPLMLAFDTPVPFSCVGRRNVSNVPAQALILMNDPFVSQQAQQWAASVLRSPTSTAEERITRMYRAALARSPYPAELQATQEFLQRQAQQLGIPPEQADTDLRVWSDLAHVLFNVKEFIYLK